MSDQGFEVAVEEGIAVTLPSGATFEVLTDTEASYVEERVRRYLTDNHFTNVSDFQDIDKMVIFELFIHRWARWMSRGVNYFDDAVDESRLSRQINEYSTELRQLKKNLGIDKVNRDRQRGDDSIASYMDKLRERAKEFGVMRDTQSAKAIELFQQLKALVIFHDNADEIERRESQVTQDDLLEWVRGVAIPEFDRIDAEFRKGQQRMWIRDQ